MTVLTLSGHSVKEQVYLHGDAVTIDNIYFFRIFRLHSTFHFLLLSSLFFYRFQLISFFLSTYLFFRFSFLSLFPSHLCSACPSPSLFFLFPFIATSFPSGLCFCFFPSRLIYVYLRPFSFYRSPLPRFLVIPLFPHSLHLGISRFFHSPPLFPSFSLFLTYDEIYIMPWPAQLCFSVWKGYLHKSINEQYVSTHTETLQTWFFKGKLDKKIRHQARYKCCGIHRFLINTEEWMYSNQTAELHQLSCSTLNASSFSRTWDHVWLVSMNWIVSCLWSCFHPLRENCCHSSQQTLKFIFVRKFLYSENSAFCFELNDR